MFNWLYLNASRYYVRVKYGPFINEIAYLCILLLYLKATRLAIDDMAMSYSHQLAVLLTILLEVIVDGSISHCSPSKVDVVGLRTLHFP